MQQKRIRRPPGQKYTPRPVITTRDTRVCERWQQSVEDEAPLDPRQFAAGWVQHPQTKLYQVWLSTNGLDVICISAHWDKIQAEADVRAIKLLIISGDLYDEEKTTTLIAQLKQGSSEEPRALPDDLVRRICRAVLRAVVDHPQPDTLPACSDQHPLDEGPTR